MTAQAGSAGTAGRRYKTEPPVGKHRAPPDPPPPDRWTAPIAAAAALLAGLSLIAIVAPGFGYDATAADRDVTVSTASRTARTVNIPLTILPAPVPTIGAEGAWDPETVVTPKTEIALSRPRSFAGVQGHAEAPVRASTRLSEVTQAITTPDRPPATLPEVVTTDSTTAASPASTFEAAAATSSALTSTEETPMTTEPTQSAEPTDVIGDVTDVIEEVGP